MSFINYRNKVSKTSSVLQFSLVGSFHSQKNAKNEDVILRKSTENFELIALADGASCCKYARIGAKIACQTVVDLFLGCFSLFFNSSLEKCTRLITDEIYKRLLSFSSEKGCDVTELSSTLCFACLNKQTRRIFLFQLGDSNIYLISQCEVSSLCPKIKQRQGFTANKDAYRYANVFFSDVSSFNSVLLCSDGAWKLMYNKNIFDKNLCEYLKQKHYSRLLSFIVSKTRPDDTSCILLDLTRHSLKGEAI